MTQIWQLDEMEQFRKHQLARLTHYEINRVTPQWLKQCNFLFENSLWSCLQAYIPARKNSTKHFKINNATGFHLESTRRASQCEMVSSIWVPESHKAQKKKTTD